MSAEVESMFYVSNEENERFVPWHGLGESLETAPNSRDAITMAGLDWKVEGKPIYTETGLEIPGFKANTRDKDGKVMGVVSDRYKIIQNNEAFEFTDALINNVDEVKYETAGSLSGGKRVWLLAKMPTTKVLNDDVDPYICFTNDFAGTGAVKVCMTPIRVVCNNTLNFALNSAKRTWSTRHMGDIQSKLQEAKITLGLANNYMNALDVEANRLTSIKMTDSDFEAYFDELYPIDPLNDSERKIRNIIDMKTRLFKCLEANDIRIYAGTAYYYLQAVSDFVTHATPQRITNSFRENNWGKIMSGHPLMDAMYNKITK